MWNVAVLEDNSGMRPEPDDSSQELAGSSLEFAGGSSFEVV